MAAIPVRRPISYSLNTNEILVAFSPLAKEEHFVHARQMRIHKADTIGAVRTRLAGLLNVPEENIVLIFNNNQLDPARTVGFYGLANDAHLRYVLQD